jgi:spore germination protein
MTNLEAKKYMSPLQLAIVVFVTCVGGQIMLSPRELLESAGQSAWLAIIIGGVAFYVSVCLMLKLGKEYPDETIVDYAPKIFGRWGGGLVIGWFNALFFLQIIEIFYGVGKIITFYMFDRTPPEVVILSLLVVCTYCALQEWGTILRIQQILFFVAYSMLIIVWMTSLLNLQLENLLPLWPRDTKLVISAGFSTWPMYSGYECVLLLLPMVYRHASLSKLVKTMGGAFGCLTLIFLLVIIIIIGVLTVDHGKSMPYPALTVIRSVELPGTFIERLENYLLLAWIPIVFDTLAAMMFFMGQVCMRQYRQVDHRPWVLLWVPIIYVSSLLLDDQQLYNTVNKYTLWAGLSFSFGVMPLSLLVSWWQKWRARKDGG